MCFFFLRAPKEQFVNAEQHTVTRHVTANSRRTSKVEAAENARWSVEANQAEVKYGYGLTNVAYAYENSRMLGSSNNLVNPNKNESTRRMLDTDGYAIKKSGNNLEITMPVAHDVYTSHQVQNKSMSTRMLPSFVVNADHFKSSNTAADYDDSNESSV